MNGNIINITSIAAFRAFPVLGSYCVSKAGADHLTRVCALEFAKYKIRVNAIRPATVITDFHANAGHANPENVMFFCLCVLFNDFHVFFVNTGKKHTQIWQNKKKNINLCNSIMKHHVHYIQLVVVEM